jgi:integrase
MTPLSYCSFLSRLEGIRVGLGMPRLSTHSMRRTGANLLRLSGADLEVIRVFLGHSTIEQTRAYLGVSREERIAAVERHAALLQDARLEASRARPEPVPVLPPCDPLPSPDWSI